MKNIKLNYYKLFRSATFGIVAYTIILSIINWNV
jgi:hypothetical protein